MQLIQYKQLFLNEVGSKLKEFEDIVLQLEKHPDNTLLIEKALIILHALKSDAATMNYLQLANSAHAVEDFCISIKQGVRKLLPKHIDALFILIDAFRSDLHHISETNTEIDLGPAIAFTVRTDHSATSGAGKRLSATDEPQDMYAPLGSFVDISSEQLESALTMANDLVASNQQIQRLLNKGDIGGVKVGLFNLASRASTMRQAVVTMKMIPVRQYFVFLARLVRDLARQKRIFIKFVFNDNELRFERHILESIREVCVQLIKNAIDHGFKENEKGTVTLTFGFKSDKLLVQVADTGHGIDWHTLKRRAVSEKIMAPSASMSPAKQYELLFTHGISSKASASLVSGRGIGLPSVQAAVSRLGGTISFETSRAGTRFEVLAPLTPTLFRALAWHWGPYYLALPLFAIEKVIQLPQQETAQARKKYAYRGTNLPVVDLARMLQLPAAASGGMIDALAIISVDGKRLAIPIPAGCTEQELIVQRLRSLAKFSVFSGAAVSEDSKPILIINHRKLKL